MNNSSFAEIAELLKASKSAALFPHVNMDGDALGSCVALCLALRSMGKKAVIVYDDKIPDNLLFLAGDMVTGDPEKIKDIDVALCIDCGEIGRLGSRGAAFTAAPKRVCIDHHVSSTPFCDLNHIDPDAAATGELVYHVIKALGIDGNKEIGNAIFAAISSDTGSFKYSNTSKETHLIVSELYDFGIEPAAVSVELYECNRLERLKIESAAIANMKSYLNGQLVMTSVTSEMLKETGAYMDETDQIVAIMRGIKGAEASVLLKEEGDKTVKVSLRSKLWLDVSEISKQLGGGGHARAAGATLHMSIGEAFDHVREIMIGHMEK